MANAEEYLTEQEGEEFERISDPLYGILDADWIGQAFLVNPLDLDDIDRYNRTWSTADLKFTDSSVGGNIVINPVPQPSRLTDPRIRGRRRGGKRVTLAYDVNVGMGPWYSETIDDNADILHLQFGVKEFNSLVTFWSRSVDYATSVIVNSGRSPIAYTAGDWVGTAAVFTAFPGLTIAIYGIKALLQLTSSDKAFAYYYMKPDMISFWKTANIMVTTFCLEAGILAPSFMTGNNLAERIGLPVQIDQDDLKEIKALLPNMFTKNNNIDLMFLAGRAQRLANAQLRIERNLFEEGILYNKDFIGHVRESTSTREKTMQGEGVISALNEVFSISAMPKAVYDMASEVKTVDDLDNIAQTKGQAAYGYKDPYVSTADSNSSPSTDLENVTNEGTDGYAATVSKTIKDFFSAAGESFDSAVRGGGAYLNLKVDHVGSYTDSIDNSTTSIPAEDAVKQLSASAKSVAYSFNGGNIAGNIDTALKYFGDFASGTLNGVTFGLASAIPALTGGGYIDIPKMWDDSTFTSPTTSFTIPLLSPSADTISKLIYEWIPLCAIMAGALPRAIGNSSYSSPFLCSAFMKGKLKIDLGMITAIGIQRSTANLGYDKQGRALGIDVSLTISDLSNRMTAPVSNSAVGTFFSSLNDDSAINRYISTVAARDLMTNKFSVPKAKIKLSRALMSLDTATSASFFGARAGSLLNPILGGMLHENNLTLLHTNNLNR